MTVLSDIERQQLMADMASFDEEMPSIGVFFYDDVKHSFYDVEKKELTPKMVEEAENKDLQYIQYPYPPIQNGTEKYYGRVIWNGDKFIVFVGTWADSVKDELSALIEEHFHLPYFEIFPFCPQQIAEKQ